MNNRDHRKKKRAYSSYVAAQINNLTAEEKRERREAKRQLNKVYSSQEARLVADEIAVAREEMNL